MQSFRDAKWIWDHGSVNPRNYYLCFRRRVTIDNEVVDARLNITADSRYTLWINGQWINRGPVRGWQKQWFYDTYDVTSYLKPGKNVIAVLVHHYGIGTSQYIAERGGFLAQLEVKTKNQDSANLIVISTDETWRVRQNLGYEPNTPRIFLQQGYVEQFDARKEPMGWTEVDFDDTNWERAYLIGPPGYPPWTRLQPRNIPFHTIEPRYPVRAYNAQLTHCNFDVWGIDLRSFIFPEKLDISFERISIIIATTVSVNKEADAIFYLSPLSPGLATTAKIRINGKILKDRVKKQWTGAKLAQGKLLPGENLITFTINTVGLEWSFRLAVKSDQILKPQVPGSRNRFAVFAFSTNEVDSFSVCACAKSWNELDANKMQIVPPKQEIAAPTMEKFVWATKKTGQPHIENMQYANSGSSDYMTIYPNADGADIELNFEFEKLLSGLIEFDICAPEGVILDWLGLEAYINGQEDYPSSLDNTMQYITRTGWQNYRSVQLRGMRYLKLVLRNLSAPLIIREIKCILHTYPATQFGSFRCNDLVLQKAYEISAWTTRLCSDDTFVDCPTYEQAFWIGDARNESLVSLVNHRAQDLCRRCLKLAADSMQRSPVVESMAPSAFLNIITTFSFLWILSCEEYHQHTGDISLLQEVYPQIAEQIYYCKDQLIDESNLLVVPWPNMIVGCFLDWSNMDTPSSGTVTHLNAWFVEACRRAARIAEILGHNSDITSFQKIATKVSQAINEHLWVEEQQAYVDCRRPDGTLSPIFSEQTNIICYLCNIAPPGRAQIIKHHINNTPTNFVRTISPFMMFFTLEALMKMRDYAAMLKMIRQNWGYMIEKNSTTCWENMPGWSPPGKWTRSHCHGWSAAPAYFLPVAILGIHCLRAGFSEIEIAPQPVDLKWAVGRVPTPRGDIKVAWENNEHSFDIKVKLPEGITGQVKIPMPCTLYANISVSGDKIDQIKMVNGNWCVKFLTGGDFRVMVKK